MTKIFILVMVMVLPIKIYAQDLANFNAAFVDIGFGARPLGMGGAYSALSSGADAVQWNPAGIAEVNGFEGTVSYTKLFNIIPYSFAALAFSPSNKHYFGAGLIVAGDQLLTELSLISCYGTGFQIKNHKMNVGVTLTLHNASFGKENPTNSAVTGDAFGFALGCGVQYYLSPKIVLASQLQNIINRIDWNTSTSGKYAEGLPRRLIFGIAFKNYHSLNFDIDFHKSLYQEIEDKIYLGAERVFLEKIFLRTGSGTSINQAQPLFYTLGFGAGHLINQKLHFQFDGAYIFHPLQNMFRVSLSFRIK
jgi:hypothetical protein